MESQNFYFLVHGSPVSFIQDCKTSSLVAFYIATEPKLVYLLVYMVCTASDKQKFKDFSRPKGPVTIYRGGGGVGLVQIGGGSPIFMQSFPRYTQC